MARRRTSAPERIAGDILGFTTGADVEESEALLTKYFPELSLRLPAKSSRGGRLGRAPQTAEQVVSYTPKEMLQGSRGGASGGSANVTITAPVSLSQTQTGASDFASQIEDLKKTLLSQSETLKQLTTPKKPEGEMEQKPVTAPQVPQEAARDFTPVNLNPQTSEEAIEYLYQTQLGRTPVQSEIKNWLQDPAFADKSLTSEEWKSLTSQFQGSPEYQKLKPPAGGSTPAAASTPAQAPASAPARSFEPSNMNPQTSEEAVKYLYQTQLGRTPTSLETASWLKNPAFSDASLSASEWNTLTSAFKSSPEYASIRR
jgi:hypothetical protein